MFPLQMLFVALLGWLECERGQSHAESTIASNDLLQDVAVEREIGDHLLQVPILVAQRSQLAELLDAQSRKLFLP